MLDAVFKEVKSVFGKVYLLTGLLPAVLFLVGWNWYSLGIEPFENLVTSWLNSKEGFVSASFRELTKLFVIGLVFFSLRNPILFLVRDLPGSYLAWLRNKLIDRHLKRKQRLEIQREHLLWQLTVARWYDIKFAKPQYVPSPQMGLPQVEGASQKARLEAQRALHTNTAATLTQKQCEVILAGLCQLYASLVSDDRRKAEQRRWKKLRDKDKRLKDVFECLEELVMRRYLTVFSKLKRFPDRRWMQPTGLGNQMAALGDYAELRYGIDTNTLWTRLREIAPKAAQEAVATAQLNIETLLNLAAASSVLAVAVILRCGFASYEALRGGAVGIDWWSALFFTGSLVTAVLLQRAAVYAASVYREKIISVVDAHALRLLNFLGFQPKTVGEMRDLYQHLQAFFVQAVKLDRSILLYQPSKSGEERDDTHEKG